MRYLYTRFHLLLEVNFVPIKVHILLCCSLFSAYFDNYSNLCFQLTLANLRQLRSRGHRMPNYLQILELRKFLKSLHKQKFLRLQSALFSNFLLALFIFFMFYFFLHCSTLPLTRSELIFEHSKIYYSQEDVN